MPQYGVYQIPFMGCKLENGGVFFNPGVRQLHLRLSLRWRCCEKLVDGPAASLKYLSRCHLEGASVSGFMRPLHRADKTLDSSKLTAEWEEFPSLSPRVVIPRKFSSTLSFAISENSAPDRHCWGC